MRAIPDSWLLVDVLRLAARSAKGRDVLCDARGRRCMWGQALSRLGVADETMRSLAGLPYASLRRSLRVSWFWMPGAIDWDDGDKEAALRRARIALRSLTVGQAREALRRIGWLPEGGR